MVYNLSWEMCEIYYTCLDVNNLLDYFFYKVCGIHLRVLSGYKNICSDG